jgi:hypothetical protein
MKKNRWIKLKIPLKLSENNIELIFGKLIGIKSLEKEYWLYKFKEFEVVALDLGNSKIKIVKIRRK